MDISTASRSKARSVSVVSTTAFISHPGQFPSSSTRKQANVFPRQGVQAGRAAFFDLAINGVWGGLITGDKVEIDWSECPCGRTTAHLSGDISRFSVEQGGTDKITCTATPEAHEEALDFLTKF